MSAPAPIQVAAIVASTREGRLADAVAAWFLGVAAGRPDMEVDAIDLALTPLPERLPERHPRRGGYGDDVQAFAERIGRAEAFVVITPEYNHGYPGALKNALDLVNAQWRAKPVAFVSYGGVAGGVRAVEQLRQVVVELHMAPLRDAVSIPTARRAFAGGALADPDGRIADDAATMLDRLAWWARALAEARRAAPYD